MSVPAWRPRLTILIVLAALCGCAVERAPTPPVEAPRLANAQTRIDGRLRATAADIPYLLYPIEVDRNYHSASEAARKTVHLLDGVTASEVSEAFRRGQIKQYIPPQGTAQGFVYTVPNTGIKAFTVKLLGPGGVLEVDEARNALVQDLLMSGGIEKFGYVRGVPPSLRAAPSRSFGDQAISTDGLRAVFMFSQRYFDIRETPIFNWIWPHAYEGLQQYLDAEAERESRTKP